MPDPKPHPLGSTGKMDAYVVDAFSSGPFSGNATMVCMLPGDSVVPDDLFQKIASEMNLSETAFVSFAPV